jgi:hypothetical protein
VIQRVWLQETLVTKRQRRRSAQRPAIHSEKQKQALKSRFDIDQLT